MRSKWRRTALRRSYITGRLVPCSSVFILITWTLCFLYLDPRSEVTFPNGSLVLDGFTTRTNSMKHTFIPHVDECKICRHCLTTDGVEEPSEGLQGASCTSGLPRNLDQTSHWDLSGKNASTHTKFPSCDVCKGCRHNLTRIDADVNAFNATVTPRGGFSSAWIYRVSNLCQRHGEVYNNGKKPMGDLIVKIWCAPFTRENHSNPLWVMKLRRWMGKEMKPKPTVRRDPFKMLSCDPEKVTKSVKMELAVSRIAKACDLQHLLPKVSVASVKGVMPETGHPVDWDGLFMTEAQGISVHSAASWDVDADVIERALMRGVNSSQVVEAAIFDLLTTQCDRHSNNIFIDESGSLTLIDNGDALGYRDMCPNGFVLNSLLLPSTPEHTYKAVGEKFARSGFTMWIYPSPLPHVVMDYRCHAPNSTIGWNYPPGVQKCLQRISGSTEQDLKLVFGLLNDEMAGVLKERATDMIERGFEWTLYNGQPRNPTKHRFVPQPTCCKMHQAPSEDLVWGLPWMFYCDDGWLPNIDIHGTP